MGGNTASWLDVKAHDPGGTARDQGQGQVWEQRGGFSQGDIITTYREKQGTVLVGLQKKRRKQIAYLELIFYQTNLRIQKKLGELLFSFPCLSRSNTH